MSENGLVVTNRLGIHLYHIPELKAVGDDSHVIPIWSWLGDVSEYRGTLYKTASLYPALWLLRSVTAHTLEFDVDESGCFPVVVNHHITEGQPTFLVRRHVKLQGRKGMGSDVRRGGEIAIDTVMLGTPGIARRLRGPLPGLYHGPWYDQDQVKYMDLDEATGRIVIALGRIGRRENIYARWLCLADLPI